MKTRISMKMKNVESQCAVKDLPKASSSRMNNINRSLIIIRPFTKNTSEADPIEPSLIAVLSPTNTQTRTHFKTPTISREDTMYMTLEKELFTKYAESITKDPNIRRSRQNIFRSSSELRFNPTSSCGTSTYRKPNLCRISSNPKFADNHFMITTTNPVLEKPLSINTLKTCNRKLRTQQAYSKAIFECVPRISHDNKKEKTAKRTVNNIQIITST